MNSSKAEAVRFDTTSKKELIAAAVEEVEGPKEGPPEDLSVDDEDIYSEFVSSKKKGNSVVIEKQKTLE